MSLFSEWDWHVTVCLHTVTDAHRHRWRQQTSICSFLCRETESSQTGRPASALLVWTHPLLDLSSSRSSQPTAVVLCDAVHTSVWRSIMVELYTQTYCIILPVLWIILHCTCAMFMLRSQKNPPKHSHTIFWVCANFKPSEIELQNLM